MENDSTVDPNLKRSEVEIFVDSLNSDISPYAVSRAVRNFVDGFETEIQPNILDDLEKELTKYDGLIINVFNGSKLNRKRHDQALRAVEELKREIQKKASGTGQYNLGKISKLDFIRVAYVMHKMGFVRTPDGQIPSIKDYMNALGNFYSMDLSQYNASLSQGNNAAGDNTRFEIFHKMLETAKNLWHDK